MEDADYLKLSEAKAAAAAKHDDGKRLVRERIAGVILEAPAFALQFAAGALENQTAVWQQWSRSAWGEILRTRTPEEIAAILVNPADGKQQALADSHPFGGLSSVVRK